MFIIFAAILMHELLTDFGGSAVNTRLSENSHQAVGFHPQIFDQLQMETAYQIEITVTEQPREKSVMVKDGFL